MQQVSALMPSGPLCFGVVTGLGSQKKQVAFSLGLDAEYDICGVTIVVSHIEWSQMSGR